MNTKEDRLDKLWIWLSASLDIKDISYSCTETPWSPKDIFVDIFVDRKRFTF